MVRLTAKTKPLIFSSIASLGSLLLGQSVLLFEMEMTTISHCRSLSMQNIFFYNQSMSHQESIARKGESLERFVLPRYCNVLLPKEQATTVEKLGHQTVSSGTGDILFKTYADAYSTLEDGYNSRQLPLLVALLCLNVAALALQAIHLYEDSKEKLDQD